MTIAILFDNGKEIRIKCESFKTDRSLINGRLGAITFEGATENKPLYVDLDHVIAIYRVLSDEEDIVEEL